MLANQQSFVDYGLASAKKSLVMKEWLPQAERSIRCLIGSDKYDELVAVTDSSSAILIAEKERAKHALALYAWYHATPFLNLTPADCGGFVRATGFDSSRVEIMSKRELDSYRKEAKAQAVELLGDMVLIDGSVFAAI